MPTNEFKGIKLSRSGFGTMRLPVVDGNTSAIDEKQVDAMVDYAISHGINYFDTAHPYHGGMSEKVVGKSLSRYPRKLLGFSGLSLLYRKGTPLPQQPSRTAST